MVASGASKLEAEPPVPLGAVALSEDDVLHPFTQPQCSLAVQLRRATGAVVGRPVELEAIDQELDSGRRHLAAVTLEGEPGIGKTRLLVAASEIAARKEFTCVAVTADEEIRGPFLVAQSIFAAPALRAAVAGTPAGEALDRASNAISGRDEAGFEALPPEGKLLRTFDLASIALAQAASLQPLALLIDDVQWADDDTLRLLRYVARTDSDRPIFLLLAIRPDEVASVTEAVNLIADMERMGLVRRLRLGRFSQLETAELCRRVLGATIEPASAATLHAQAEGVPFIVEELTRTYRENGMLQQVDGVWTLARNAGRLVPSAVRTLIQRRAARLPQETRDAMGDAALLGRSFSLRDLAAIRLRLDGSGAAPGVLAEALAPAAGAGLLLEHPESSAADYTFSHEQVRDFAIAGLPQARRRAVHAAIVELLAGDGEPAPASLPLLAQHALAAGDSERAARFSIEAAHVALQSNAPEEALRIVEQALPIVSTSQERRTLLTARDDAYAVLRRAGDRLDGLAELGALAEALRDSHFELDVMLRRSAALRLAGEPDSAAALARRVRGLAAERGDLAAELAACLELGQALLRAPLGEGFGSASGEADLDGAEEAYRRAAELATELGDERGVAAAIREVAMILLSRVREWFGEQLRAGRAMEFGQRLASGEELDDMLLTFPIAPIVGEIKGLLDKALGIYERLGDRRGVMSTVIAMAYTNYAPIIHFASSARHIEEIRRVTSRLSSMVTESERARLELQMLYGVHVFARSKIVPDLELARGEEAYRSAQMVGDRTIEFLAAGGMALAHMGLGEIAETERWLTRAGNAAAVAPTTVRARQLETWRGMARAAAGDGAGMRNHLERAVKMAADQGRPAARCESLARLAIEAARLGARLQDEELLTLAERSALDAKELTTLLPGHAPWGPQADAALAEVALARNQPERAVAAAGSAIQAFQEALHEDVNLDVLLIATRAILAGGPPDLQAMMRAWLRSILAGIAQRTLDEDVRVRWMRGPLGRELVELAGSLDGLQTEPSSDGQPDAIANLDEEERGLLKLLAAGNTNREIGAALELPPETVAQQLAGLFAKIGASSRAEATSFAFRGHLV
jgi:DNA-binding NarL/FixJ family response regulator